METPVLTVPNWSLGRERSVLHQGLDLLESADVTVHFAEADLDHNRTVTAFSGDASEVLVTLFELARVWLPAINLHRHVGVHPRIGGLDVCPWIPLAPVSPHFGEWIIESAQAFAEEFEIPVFLYEHSASAGSKASLPELRKGGFGALVGQEITPDFGPNQAHPYLGATVWGWRDFLVALNVNFPSENLEAAERIAAEIRSRRRAGEPGFEGVRSLGLSLADQGLVQVSLNLTQPFASKINPVVAFILESAGARGLEGGYTELIGVIPESLARESSLVYPRAAQIVKMEGYEPAI
ncbi:MAG: hypothetical protein LCH41_00160 [Armatimonadetes bacterium]|nr:hypothetical protein [Armatimonadota bacterium]